MATRICVYIISLSLLVKLALSFYVHEEFHGKNFSSTVKLLFEE